ncbi:hypothetical protein COOONC_01602 [Cooperia oncophora]
MPVDQRLPVLIHDRNSIAVPDEFRCPVVAFIRAVCTMAYCTPIDVFGIAFLKTVVDSQESGKVENDILISVLKSEARFDVQDIHESVKTTKVPIIVRDLHMTSPANPLRIKRITSIRTKKLRYG